MMGLYDSTLWKVSSCKMNNQRDLKSLLNKENMMNGLAPFGEVPIQWDTKGLRIWHLIKTVGTQIGHNINSK